MPDERGPDRGGRYRRRAAGLVLAGAASVAAWYAFGYIRAEQKPTRGTRPPSVSAPPPVAQATVSLPRTEAPAAAEALQAEARKTAEALRGRWPDSPEALHVAAIVHAMLRETAEAERLWQRCIGLDPQGTRYYVNLAAVAIDRGDSELARQTLEQALETGCASADVYHHLALALNNLGRCEEAVATAEKGLAAYPDSAACRRMLGESQLKLGQAAEAEANLRRAIELGSSGASAYFALAAACARQGKREEAAAFRQRFAELKASEPIDPQERYQVLTAAEARQNATAALWEAATVTAWKGDLAAAEKLLLRAVELDPSRGDFLRALDALYRNQRRYADAERVLARLVELEPQDLGHRLMRARVQARLGQSAAAEATLKELINSQPEMAAGYAGLARLYFDERRLAEARWHAEEAVRWSPEAAHYRLLAEICRRSGDSAAAEAATSEAAKRSPPEAPTP